MGFWNKVAQIITAPQKVYATVVKKIGDKMSESYKAPIFKMGWKLQDAAEWLTPKCYKAETATVSKVIDISSDCQKYFNIRNGVGSTLSEAPCRGAEGREQP